MQQHDHDPYKEKYGRHSNFRSESNDDTSSGSPFTRLFFIVAGLAAAVVAYDRLHGRQDKAPDTPAPSVVSRQAISRPVKASPPPVAENEPTPADEEPVAEAIPTIATMETPAPPALSSPQEASPAPAEAEKQPEPPKIDVARYEMKATLGGHSFMGPGIINGKGMSFLFDTGASMVVVPKGVAVGLGLKEGREMPVKTANGIVKGRMTVIETLTLGEIELHNVGALINPEMKEDFALLGMTALKLLEVQMENDKVVLLHKQPRASGADMRTVEEERFTRSVKDCASTKGNKFDKQTLDCLRGN